MIGRIASGIALASMAGLMLAGCAPGDPVETSTPSSTPMNSDDEDRQSLEDARRAWDAYQSRIAQLEADPADATLEDLRAVAQEDLALALLADLERAASLEVRTEGERSTTDLFASDLHNAPHEVVVSACVDVSGVRVVGSDGSDQTPPTFGPRLSYSVTLTRADVADPLLVSSAEEYQGSAEQDPCS